MRPDPGGLHPASVTSGLSPLARATLHSSVPVNQLQRSSLQRRNLPLSNAIHDAPGWLSCKYSLIPAEISKPTAVKIKNLHIFPQ